MERETALGRSAGQIARDVEAIARTWSKESRLARDEAVGAELLLSRELIEQFGILFETADRLNDLALRQAGHALRDWTATIRHAAAEPGLHNCRDLAFDHLRRRIDHVTEGANELRSTVDSAARRLGDTVFALWRPFLTVLGRDWRDRQSGSGSP